MKNKNIGRRLALFALSLVIMLLLCPAGTVKAEEGDAFIVEEEGVIGGEVPAQEAPAIVMPGEMTGQKEESAPVEFKEKRKEKLKLEETEPKEETSNGIMPAVSVNTAGFSVPKVRRGSREKNAGKQQALPEIVPAKKTESFDDVTRSPQREYVVGFLAVACSCLVLGILQIIRRLLIGYGKL